MVFFQSFETTEQQIVSLYRITDESGKLEAIPVAQKPFKQEQLNENVKIFSFYIFDKNLKIVILE